MCAQARVCVCACCVLWQGLAALTCVTHNAPLLLICVYAFPYLFQYSGCFYPAEKPLTMYAIVFAFSRNWFL